MEQAYITVHACRLEFGGGGILKCSSLEYLSEGGGSIKMNLIEID
jgi:hypothetical protein